MVTNYVVWWPSLRRQGAELSGMRVALVEPIQCVEPIDCIEISFRLVRVRFGSMSAAAVAAWRRHSVVSE